MYSPDIAKGLECYMDADFVGGWDAQNANNAQNVLHVSRTGFVIMYAGCPIHRLR